MKQGIPWSIKGIEPEVRQAAKHAAKRSGMTLGAWLNSIIADQAEGNDTAERPPITPPTNDKPRRPYSAKASSVTEETVLRLEDVARQLSRLAQRDNDTIAGNFVDHKPHAERLGEPQSEPSYKSEPSELTRLVSRLENGERQTFEALSAVNERLSILGRQVTHISRAQPPNPERPEDVPGYRALEQALRNIVEHIETSEKRNRDTFKSLQERLADMAHRSSQTNNEQLAQTTAPALGKLEARLSELAKRIEHSEETVRANLPDLVQREFNALSQRIEKVDESSKSVASQAHNAAMQATRNELRAIEKHIQGLVYEAQTAFSAGQGNSAAAELQHLQAETTQLNDRINAMQSHLASDSDVDALRAAIEQLSARVAQSPDPRPMAEIDRRLGEVMQHLEHNQQQLRDNPQMSELEQRLAELDHRLGEALHFQADAPASDAMHEQFALMTERLDRTEQQLSHMDTLEKAINQLYEGLEQQRNSASEMAEEAANRAIERFSGQTGLSETGTASAEIAALEDGLRAVRESAAQADQRNQETLEAVHGTLEQIVNKLVELEAGSVGQNLTSVMQQPIAPSHLPPMPMPSNDGAHFHPSQHSLGGGQAHDPWTKAQLTPDYSYADDPGSALDNPFASPSLPMGHDSSAAMMNSNPFATPAAPTNSADDFIAAARRAAQSASGYGNASANINDMRGGNSANGSKKNGFKLSIPALNKNAGLGSSSEKSSKRRSLILAGIGLLLAFSVYTLSNLGGSTPVAPVSSQLQDTPKRTASHRIIDVEKKPDLAAIEPITTASLPPTLESGLTDSDATNVNDMLPPQAGPEAMRRAALAGQAEAQSMIANNYLAGQTVAQDPEKAFYWYQKAAKQGFAPAQYRLASMYERGRGVTMNMASALIWYERAASQGNVGAMHNAAVIASSGQVGPADFARAFKWLQAAAARGFKDSQFNLALLHERGLGANQSIMDALFWYSLAAKQGDKEAQARVDILSRSVPAASLNLLRKRLNDWRPIPADQKANDVAIPNNANAKARAMPPRRAPIIGAPSSGSLSLMAKDAATQIATSSASGANAITVAQQLLDKVGLPVGAADGKLNKRTNDAIRLFQKQSGARVTGQITPALIKALREKAEQVDIAGALNRN